MANLKILARDPETGRLRLGLPRPPEYVSGIDLLVQIVVVTFFNNGGRSIVNPGWAGGMRALVGSNYDISDPAEIMADIRLIVSRVEELIKQDQVRTRRPPSEMLQTLLLIDIVPDPVNPEIDVIIAVVNQEQQQSQAVVVV
jgi:hypothetical protein